jgi:hypothetical protein
MADVIDMNRNPEGKGGLQERPQDRATGRWRKEDSQSYCLNMFLKMSEEEFLKWASENPPAERTIAQTLAYNRVVKAKTDLKNWSAVTNRTEGMPRQTIDLDSKVVSKVTVEIVENGK